MERNLLSANSHQVFRAPTTLLLTCQGNLLPGAHAVDREYAVMTALRNTNVPIPTTRLFCNDKDIIGSPFFVYGTLIHSSSSFSLFTSDARFCGGTVL
jgi:aminoglycoside phosphotransferase (APT) family kinase protein